MIEIVCATRRTADDFAHNAALGRSIERLKPDHGIGSFVAAENALSLGSIYNGRIEASDVDDILVFMHDDVWIDDFFLSAHLEGALRTFDIVGVAGTRRRYPRQPAWHSLFDTLQIDWHSLSGGIAHGEQPFGDVMFFGKAPAECELLDGVFLAARRSTLLKSGLRFDPRFAFHFYDLDFCRTARSKGLRLGTWTIPLTHQSRGGFETPAWEAALADFRQKWPD